MLCRDDENRYAFVVGANGWLVSFLFWGYFLLSLWFVFELIVLSFRSLPEANLESTETHLETAIRLLQEAGESIVVTGLFSPKSQKQTEELMTTHRNIASTSLGRPDPFCLGCNPLC